MEEGVWVEVWGSTVNSVSELPEGWSRSVIYTEQSASSMEVQSWQNMGQHFEAVIESETDFMHDF